jgi:carboxylate-amine ligase
VRESMIEFTPSKPLTVGMELEYQLLNPTTFELADGIMPLMEFFRGSDNVQPEFVQEAVEVVSDPCEDCTELEERFRALVVDVESKSRDIGMCMCAAGSHPFSTRLAAITPEPRYLAIEQKSGYLSHTRITYATHVHVGVASPDEMIRLTGELVPYLPMLVALSANSPFWHGHMTGFASYRQRALAATGNYGIPPAFEDWADFKRFFKAAERAEMGTCIGDFHWDVRPQPDFGTVEVRTMDAVSTVSEAVTLASLVRTLVAYLRETPPDERSPQLPKRLPPWAERENHFRASQSALDARCLQNTRGHLASVRETIEGLIEVLEPVARRLGEAHYLERLRQMLDHDIGFERQVCTFEQTDSLEQVVRSLAAHLRADLDSESGLTAG